MLAAHGVVRRRLVDLAQILFEDHGVSVSEQTLNRVLCSMGYRKEQAHGTALALHVHRRADLGSGVPISESWCRMVLQGFS